MKIDPLAEAHPRVKDEVDPLWASEELTFAVSMLVELHMQLFDGPGVPPWLNATKRIEQASHTVLGSVDPEFRYLDYYGMQDREGIVACYAKTLTGRPVLMSVVAFPDPRAVDEQMATRVAVAEGRVRSADL